MMMPANTCGHCGMIHGPACPRIRAIEYYENGTVKRVEYHEPLTIAWPMPANNAGLYKSYAITIPPKLS